MPPAMQGAHADPTSEIALQGAAVIPVCLTLPVRYKMPPMPGKHWLRGSSDPQVVSERLESLPRVLQAIMVRDSRAPPDVHTRAPCF